MRLRKKSTEEVKGLARAKYTRKSTVISIKRAAWSHPKDSAEKTTKMKNRRCIRKRG